MDIKKILLIDDDQDFISAQSVLLGHSGYEIIVAHSGLEGFQKAKISTPDLIILDVNMETENAGFDLNRKIRNDSELSKVPIIMLTGIETYAISEEALAMYNEMMTSGQMDLQKVLKIGHNSSDVGVQYKDDNGKPFYLPLDSFVSKVNSEHWLMQEIKRFIG